MTSTIRHSSVFALLSVLALAGCEPELGSPCDPDREFVDKVVEQKPDSTALQRDVRFDNCTQALCMSVDASRPFCTKSCETDADCFEAAGFSCEQAVLFGQLACADWTEEQGCFPDGIPSTRPLKYCTTTRETIEARDEQFGRSEAAAE